MNKKRTIKQIVEEIKGIYDDYKKELKLLKEEQEEVLVKFQEKLEEKKIEEIKKSLNN